MRNYVYIFFIACFVALILHSMYTWEFGGEVGTSREVGRLREAAAVRSLDSLSLVLLTTLPRGFEWSGGVEQEPLFVRLSLEGLAAQVDLAELRAISFLVHVPPRSSLVTKQAHAAASLYADSVERYVGALRAGKVAGLPRLAVDVVRVSGSVSDAIVDGIVNVSSDYYLFWEHDWVPCRRLPIAAVVEEMTASAVDTRRPTINYVRFAKHDLVARDDIKVNDRWFGPCADCSLPLLEAVSWSNNPHVGRTRFFAERCAPRIARTGVLQSGGFVEAPITQGMMWPDFAARGYAAFSEWGTYVYGGLGMSASVLHTDGRGGWQDAPTLDELRSVSGDHYRAFCDLVVDGPTFFANYSWHGRNEDFALPVNETASRRMNN
jgi:hypothetical protein